MSPLETGLCPNCESRGDVGALCPLPGCMRWGYRHVPPQYVRQVTDRDAHIGRTINRYLLVDRVGKGGFGTVYLGLAQPSQDQVAVKLLDVKSIAESVRPTVLRKFGLEARALASIDHPNIVRLIKIGEHEGVPFIAMEYVAGGWTLGQALRDAGGDAPFSSRATADIVDQLLQGLGAAHAQSIIHRDIKPANIMLEQTGGGSPVVRLLDFGLAKFVEDGRDTTIALGTPTYMAPEQVAAGEIGPWTDLYALGCLTLHLLTGRRPFGEFDQPEVVGAKLRESYDILGRFADIPGEWRPFVAACVAWDSRGRAANVDAARALLRKAHPSISEPRELAEALPTTDSPAQDLSPMLAAPPAPASEARTRPADSQSPERAAPTKGKRYANLPTLPGLASEAGAVSQPRKRPIPKAAIAGAAVVVVGAVLMFFVAGQQEKAAGSTSVEAPAAKPGLPKGMSAGQAGMVWVGFTGSESLAFDSVGGKRRFTSVSPFEIARTETTVRQYVGCVANGGCPAPADSWSDDEYGRANNWRAPGREDHPINSIDWAGGNAFCQAVGGRLPTAAEWEWAARGAREPTAFPWGDEPLKCSRAIVPRDGDGCGTGTTGPVCSRAEGHTPEGLCDMTGNVREWTASWSLDGKFGTGPIPAGAKRIGKGPHLASPGSDLLAHGWRRGREVDSKAALYTQGFRCAR